jgi:hypothetical protein
MALDLANGYSRKDSASASNVYYGYSTNPNPADTDLTFAIRLVNTAAGVENVKWSNGEPIFISSWTGRTFSFIAPTTALNLTYSLTTNTTYYNRPTFTQSLPLGSFKNYSGSFTWSSINGVNKYLVTVKDNSGNILDKNGLKLKGPYAPNWTVNYPNTYAHSQGFIDSGTYTVMVTAQNLGGSTSSTATIYFA